MTHEPAQFRCRLTFAKHDALRFVGHLDLAKTWERVLRRAQMPLVYSHGFNPQPRMQLASALPLGISSECELLDIWLLEAVDPGAIPERLNAVSPQGLRTLAAVEVPLKGPALQAVLAGAEYRISVGQDEEVDLQQRIEAFLVQEHVRRVRRGKTYDLRPLVLDVHLEDPCTFRAHLSLGQNGTARPDELLEAMALSFEDARCHRLAIFLSEQGVSS